MLLVDSVKEKPCPKDRNTTLNCTHACAFPMARWFHLADPAHVIEHIDLCGEIIFKSGKLSHPPYGRADSKIFTASMATSLRTFATVVTSLFSEIFALGSFSNSSST